MTETIRKNKHVSLTYTITDDDGTILESSDIPIQYIHGRKNQIIEKIENALEGHSTGEIVHVKLTPKEGFGSRQPELIFTDDIENVPPQFRTVGAEVEFQNDHGENKVFRVIEIDDRKVTVDGNHPFAGLHITYNITINEVRDATPNELKKGVATMKALH